jgi:hypothetical protein
MLSQTNDDVRRWRLDTLENNLAWLASFGCTIDRHGDAISVFHPGLPEYQALLFFSDPDDLDRRLTSLSGGARGSKGPPSVYVDQSCDTAAWHNGLTRLGFRHVATSVVYAGLLRPRRNETLLQFRRAELAESDSWSAAYSAGFGRTGKQAAQDVERWRLCFRSGEAVRSWFLVLNGERIGVVQTCHAHGVVGIYSLAVLPPWRRQFGFRNAIQAAQSALPFDQPIRSYFEVVRSLGRPNRNWLVMSGDRFDVVRTTNAYAHGQSA